MVCREVYGNSREYEVVLQCFCGHCEEGILLYAYLWD